MDLKYVQFSGIKKVHNINSQIKNPIAQMKNLTSMSKVFSFINYQIILDIIFGKNEFQNQIT